MLELFKLWNLIPGGFVGKECYVETEGTNKVLEFYPEDSNKLQNFYLKERINVKKIRIAFNSSTDFYWWIMIYKLDVYTWDVAKTKVERARDIYLFCTNEVLCKVGCDTKVHILYQIYCTQVTYQNHSRVD